jgi:tetratricopeptide (TPR) repeat protein
MRRFTSPLAIVLILLSITITSERNVNAKDTWTSVKSKNFLLIGNASEKDIKQVALKLEQFRDVFSRLFPRLKVNSLVPTTVVVFKNDNSYRPFKISATTAGYFQPGPDVNYITLSAEARWEQDPFDVIFHEYTHLLVANTLADAPTWFNEGLAEYYSTFNISNDQKVQLGNPIASHVLLLRQKQLLPLRTLFEVDHNSPYYNESNKQSIFYAQSWALMHYLMLNKNTERPDQLARFLDLTNAKVPVEEAFTKAFQTTFDVMEKDLSNYIRQDRYRVLYGHFQHKLETDTELQVNQLTEAETQAYLGDLLLHTSRADCESYLLKAIALDPNLAMAHASLGMLRFRQGKVDEARSNLERAAASTQNYLIHYYYAFTLSRSRPDDSAAETGYAPGIAAKIREQLNKVIELRPDYPESYNLLAFVSLVTGNNLEETIEMMKKQIELLPGRYDFKYMLAQLYLRKDNYPAGRQLLDEVARSNGDVELAQRARALLNEIERIQTQAERLKTEWAAKSRASKQGFSGAVQDATTSTRPDPNDPSSYLREVLRPPAPDEKQLQATLVRVDCEAKGPVFVFQTEEGLLRLRADGFEQIELTTYSPEVKGDLSCGLRRPENLVVLCYVASTDKRSKTDGTVRSIEFVPKDFQLKSTVKP